MSIGAFAGMDTPRYGRRPSRLQLWLTDTILGLRWSTWSGPVARATGRISTHLYGRWTYHPTLVRASRRVVCRGRYQYSRLRYVDPDGRWRAADFERTAKGCGFSG